MEASGHETFTVDVSYSFRPTLTVDIATLNGERLPQRPDILWASPPCQGFSVAAIGRNWNYDNTPKTDSARLAMTLAQKTIQLTEETKPQWWFIENPRGKLRKMPFMQDFYRQTVTYCQYGDTRMKPTDIWTNATWWKPRPMCKNGDTCHEAAPRGAKTGTQGIKGDRDRSRIPPALFNEILTQLPQV